MKRVGCLWIIVAVLFAALPLSNAYAGDPAITALLALPVDETPTLDNVVDETPPLDGVAESQDDGAPVGNNVDSRLLWLVNIDHPLAEDYEPADLVTYNGFRLNTAARDAYIAMTDAMRKAGIDGLYIQSAYRTYAHQTRIFQNKQTMYLGLGYDEKTAAEMTARAIAYPGPSEHQTGLAIDVTTDGTLKRSFGDTAAGRWIYDHCHTYGFIVRYPEDKTAITRIMYEPWHLRYVGVPHAAFMKENDLCLEEYMDWLKANRLYIYWAEEHQFYLVWYTQSPDTRKTTVIDVSADRAGADAWRIVTTIRRAAVFFQ